MDMHSSCVVMQTSCTYSENVAGLSTTHSPCWPSARRLVVRAQPICSPEERSGSATGAQKNLQCTRNQGVIRDLCQGFATVWLPSRNYPGEQCGEMAEREALVQAY